MTARLMLAAMLVAASKTDSTMAADHVHRPQDRFIGTWLNEDQETRSITKLEVAQDENKWSIQVWGACEPDDCDWGKTKLFLLGDTVDAKDFPFAFATWDHGFATTHIVLRIEAATLVAETYDIFRDDSGRSNYRRVDRLKRAYTLKQ